MNTDGSLLLLFIYLVLVLLDNVVCLIDAKFTGFGEVGDGKGSVVEQELEKTAVEVGFGEVVVLFYDTGEASDGIVDVAGLGLLVCLLKGGEDVGLTSLFIYIICVGTGLQEGSFLVLVLYLAAILAFINLLLRVVFFDEFLVVVEVDLRFLSGLVLLP